MASNGKKTTQKKAPTTEATTVDYSKLAKDTRLIPISEWDWDRVVYSDPQKNDIPGGAGHYRRVRIQYMYDNKTIGPAIVELGKHYCFGVQPDNTDKDGKVRKDPDTGRDMPLRGYRVPIVMTSQGKNTPNPTAEEQLEVNFFDDWRSEVVRYATENKKAIGKGAKPDSWFENNVGKLLYRKEDDNGPVEGISPKLYSNLIYYSKSKEVGTTFYGPGDKEVNPLKMTGHFHIYPTIRFDNIFIGGKGISLQFQVYDATVEPVARSPKKRLAKVNTLDAEEAESFTEDTPASNGSNGNNVNDMMESEDEEEYE